MQNQVAPQIELAKTVLANLDAELLSSIEQGNSLQDKLALAQLAEQEVASALEVIAPLLVAARTAVVERAAALRTELRAAAVAEVVAMLGEGAISLEALATQAGVKVVVEGNMTFERVAPVAPVAAPDVIEAAPAPVVAAPVAVQVVAATPTPVAHASVDANGAKLAPEVRENLRLQAAYMHPVKFRDPTTGAGWSGRGPMPKWLKALLVDGKTVEAFRIGGEAPAAAPAAPAPAAEFVAAPAPVVEMAAEVIAEVVAPVAAPVSDSLDIGEEVASFDASGLDVDLNTPADGDDSDIGEFVEGIAAMGLGGNTRAGNAASFLVTA